MAKKLNSQQLLHHFEQSQRLGRPEDEDAWSRVSEDTQWHTEVSEETLRMIFRGSRNAADWRDNFRFWFAQPTRPYNDMPYAFRAHTGFVQRYKQVRSLIHDFIREQQPRRVEVYGFSLGGAIATVAHEDLMFHREKLNIDEVETFTFAAPRVFSWRTPREYFRGLHRVQLKYDLVTHVPPWVFFFRHVQEHVYRLPTQARWRIVSNHYPKSYRQVLAEL